MATSYDATNAMTDSKFKYDYVLPAINTLKKRVESIDRKIATNNQQIRNIESENKKLIEDRNRCNQAAKDLAIGFGFEHPSVFEDVIE